MVKCDAAWNAAPEVSRGVHSDQSPVMLQSGGTIPAV